MTKSNVAAVDNAAAFITYLNIVYRKEDGLCFQHLNQGQYVDDFVLPVDETDAVWLLLKLRNVIMIQALFSSMINVCSRYVTNPAIQVLLSKSSMWKIVVLHPTLR